jgi:hypothetical protein
MHGGDNIVVYCSGNNNELLLNPSRHLKSSHLILYSFHSMYLINELLLSGCEFDTSENEAESPPRDPIHKRHYPLPPHHRSSPRKLTARPRSSTTSLHRLKRTNSRRISSAIRDEEEVKVETRTKNQRCRKNVSGSLESRNG